MDTKPQTESLYPVPLSVEGFFVLHQMLRFRWAEWRKLDSIVRKQIAEEARAFFAEVETRAKGQSAVFSMVGHKGDVMLIHFRESLDQLKSAELNLSSLKLSDYLEAQT
jgi:chlorite dismutase